MTRADLFHSDPDSLAAAGRDFGDIVHEPPALVARPRTSEEVAEVVRFARARGLKLAARGVGHSTGGQAQVAGGVVVDMRELARIHAIDARAGTVDADAGLRWRALIDALDEHGLTPPVVTDWLDLSLGGTISAGGVGAQSFRAGLQTDAVEALTAVTGTGQIIECSREREPALFDALRGGLGQFGVITRVRVRVEAAPTVLRLDHLLFADPARFVEACASLIDGQLGGQAHGLLAHAIPNRREDLARSIGCAPEALDPAAARSADGRWRYHLELSRVETQAPPAREPAGRSTDELARRLGAIAGLATSRRWRFSEFVRRVPPIVERDRRIGRASHPRVTLFVDHAHAASLIAEVMDDLRHEDLGGGPILLIPFQTASIQSPFVRLPRADKVWLFGILRAAATPESIDAMTRANVDVWRRGTRVGALRYPVDGLPRPCSAAGWAAHYGDLWDHAVALKHRYDPDLLFSPRLGIFAVET